jgi:hypothetical protein
MKPCAYCGARTLDVFCSKMCAHNHDAFDRVLIVVDGDVAESVRQFGRDAGTGYAATWETLIRTVLDRAGAPL